MYIFYFLVVVYFIAVLTTTNGQLTLPWEEITPTGTNPSARRSHIAIRYKDNMYVFGGTDDIGNFFNDVYAFNLITTTWVAVNPSGTIPNGRYCPTAIFYKDNMVVFGGVASGNTVNVDVHKLNLITNNKSLSLNVS